MKTFRKIPSLVIAEAKALKANATQEELNRLNVEILDPDSKFYCIYGLMTENCFSERAKELIEKSCSRVYDTYGSLEVKNKLNGTPIGKYRSTDGGSCFGKKTSYWSPIEVFIANTTQKNRAKLVRFLKGEINKL